AQRSAQQQATEEADAAARAVVAKYRDLGTGADDAQINEAKTELKLLADAPLSRPVRDEVQTLRQHLAALGQQRKLKAKLDNWKTLINERVSNALTPEQVPSNWQNLVNGATPLAGRDLVIRAEIVAGQETPDSDQG